MNSFDVVFNELKKSGLGVDIKRKRDDGTMVDARENELASLGTKATVASTAGLLKKLSPAEKLSWAIETKNEANELYKIHDFSGAMGKYVESLAGSDFGDKEPGSTNKGNVDTLIVPVLCNLAACSIQVKEWGKAVSFGEQAVLLRPNCCKAHLRKGIGLMHLGEHELALASFAKAEATASNKQTSNDINPTSEESSRSGEVNDSTSGEVNDIMFEEYNQHSELSESDWKRLPVLVAQAKRGFAQHRRQMKQRREALAKGFARNSAISETREFKSNTITSMERVAEKNDPSPASGKPEIMTISEFVLFIIQYFVDFLTGIFSKQKTN